MSIIVLELILVAAVALGLGAWQLYDVNRALRAHREEDESSEAAPNGENEQGAQADERRRDG